MTPTERLTEKLRALTASGRLTWRYASADLIQAKWLGHFFLLRRDGTFVLAGVPDGCPDRGIATVAPELFDELAPKPKEIHA